MQNTKSETAEAAGAFVGGILGLWLIVLAISAPDDVWNRYVAPGLMLIMVLALVGAAVISALHLSLTIKK